MSESEDSTPTPPDDPEPLSAIELSVSVCDEQLGERLRHAAVSALSRHGIRSGRLEIAVVDDAEMRAQHARWMDDDSSTDSLAFDLRDELDEEVVDGQLIVCEDVARRRAASPGHDWQNELTLYVVHGCLHLCGFDDDAPAASARMHAEEDRILTSLGLPPVFAQGASPDEGAPQ